MGSYPDTPPNCYQCVHYHTTWEPKNPNGCRKFGFKSKQLPSIAVLASSGEQCVFFYSNQPQPQMMEESSETLPRDGTTFSAMG